MFSEGNQTKLTLQSQVSMNDVSISFNSFLASGDFCCLLITFSNSLDPDQDQLSIGQDLDPNRLAL